MKRDSFIFYRVWLDDIKNSDIGLFVFSICKYIFDDKEPELNEDLVKSFEKIRAQLDMQKR